MVCVLLLPVFMENPPRMYACVWYTLTPDASCPYISYIAKVVAVNHLRVAIQTQLNCQLSANWWLVTQDDAIIETTAKFTSFAVSVLSYGIRCTPLDDYDSIVSFHVVIAREALQKWEGSTPHGNAAVILLRSYQSFTKSCLWNWEHPHTHPCYAWKRPK